MRARGIKPQLYLWFSIRLNNAWYARLFALELLKQINKVQPKHPVVLLKPLIDHTGSIIHIQAGEILALNKVGATSGAAPRQRSASTLRSVIFQEYMSVRPVTWGNVSGPSWMHLRQRGDDVWADLLLRRRRRRSEAKQLLFQCSPLRNGTVRSKENLGGDLKHRW